MFYLNGCEMPSATTQGQETAFISQTKHPPLPISANPNTHSAITRRRRTAITAEILPVALKVPDWYQVKKFRVAICDSNGGNLAIIFQTLNFNTNFCIFMQLK